MNKRGFTLVELMIVVVILGILAAITIPNFVTMVGRAREASTKKNMHLLQTATEDFAAVSSGRYPDERSDTSDDGQTLVQHVPGLGVPENPWTQTGDDRPVRLRSHARQPGGDRLQSPRPRIPIASRPWATTAP
jgi:prepilin-type N-terminal cleavage/methylation domain-containing protein